MDPIEFGADFGQRVDLTVRIREILRNYPEGTSILKEMVQNADDAGARRIEVCVDEREHGRTTCVDARMAAMQGPALLVYNDAVFSERDFRSIQQLGDSLKKDTRGKTGRFGIGFNSCYHVTELPCFASASKVVFFDPQARYLPNVDPSNPGKIIDVVKEAALLEKCPDQFAGLEGCFGWTRHSPHFNGTIFRLALRTEEQAAVSKLSASVHTVGAARQLIDDFAAQATEMLLFLRSVETIAVSVWRDGGKTQLHEISVKNPPRALRAGVTEGECDYELTVVSDKEERWVVCNQLGGGRATVEAAANKHLALVPWAGVAARVEGAATGRAYCFLPLPVKTGLPVHVNGFFELSSNRRDVWRSDEDAATGGDGAARARWNAALCADVAGPCYARALKRVAALVAPGAAYDSLWPDERFFDQSDSLWRLVADSCLAQLRRSPDKVLSSTLFEHRAWVSCADAVLVLEEAEAVALALSCAGVAVVVAESLRAVLASKEHSRSGRGVVGAHATAQFTVEKLVTAPLTVIEERLPREQLLKLLAFVLEVENLEGAPLIPLADGHVARFGRLSSENNVQRLMETLKCGPMKCRRALHLTKGDADAAAGLIFEQQHLDATTDLHCYFVCEEKELQLFSSGRVVRAADVGKEHKRFFASTSAADGGCWNLVYMEPRFTPELILDVGLASEDVGWYCRVLEYALSDPATAAATLAQLVSLKVLPTADGRIVPLALESGVLADDGAEGPLRLDSDALSALLKLGVLVASSGLPKNKHLRAHLHSSHTARGLLSAVRTDAALTAPEAASLRAALSRGAFDEKMLPVAKRLRLWGTYGDEKLVSMESQRGLLFFEPSDLERQILSAYYLRVASEKERKFALALGATRITRLPFIIDHVVPRLAAMIEESGGVEALVKELLTELGSLPVEEGAKMARALTPLSLVTSVTGSICRAAELYDPSARAASGAPLAMLLPPESLVSYGLAQHEQAMRGLRLLGLKTQLDWNAVLASALSVVVAAADVKAAPAAGVKAHVAAAAGSVAAAPVSVAAPPAAAAPGSTRDRAGCLLRAMDADADLFDDACFFNDEEEKPGWRGFLKVMLSSSSSSKKTEEEKRHLMAQRSDLRRRVLLELCQLPWLPVARPEDSLPWFKGDFAAPSQTRPMGDAWACSAVKFCLDSASCEKPRSKALNEAFGWDRKPDVKILATQLRKVAEAYTGDEELRRQATAELVPRLYGALDSALRNTQGGEASLRDALGGASVVWVAKKFVNAETVAFRGVPSFTNEDEAAPFMHALPGDLHCFSRVVRCLGVRECFVASDYVAVLSKLTVPLDDKQTRLALALVQALGMDPTLSNERCIDMGVLAPSGSSMVAATDLVYDDAPWLRSAGKPAHLTIHPQVSAQTALKLGCRSLRRVMLEQHTVVDSLRDLDHSAFGQTEPLTRRLRHVLELYPEGAGIISELIQNADDAGARVVKVTLDLRSRNSKSLLSPQLAEWQGPCLCVSNDAQFSEADWRNLVRVGQASKLERPDATGRFGLGFNSVYHLTDVPQLCSGEHVLFLDPHANSVPGVSSAQPGLRVRFTGADLREAFPDQFEPWAAFCDLDEPFKGTLFRLPLRTSTTSEISQRTYDADQAMALLEHFRSTILDKVLIFLRNVEHIKVSVLEDEHPERTLYEAKVTERPFKEAGDHAPHHRKAGCPVASLQASCSSKADFFAKLKQTQEVPTSIRRLSLQVMDTHKEFVVVTVIGGGRARELACEDLKAVPIGAVAYSLGSTDCSAFCFLPLPAKTGLPVQVNGHFELSSNRRDVWHGDDMTGDGQRRSEWNTHLLRDAVAVAYAKLLETLAKQQQDLPWPTRQVAAPWSVCRAALFEHSAGLKLLQCKGQLLAPRECVGVNSDSKGAEAVARMLPDLNVVLLPGALHAALVETKSLGADCTPKLLRSFYAKRTLNAPTQLAEAIDYVCEDACYEELHDVPLLLLETGEVVSFGSKEEPYYLTDDVETRNVLCGVCADRLVHSSITANVREIALSGKTRLRVATAEDVCRLVGAVLPVEAGPYGPLFGETEWLAGLWRWVASSQDEHVAVFATSRTLLPALRGTREAVLVRLDSNPPIIASSTLDDALLAQGVFVLNMSSRIPACVSAHVARPDVSGVLGVLGRSSPNKSKGAREIRQWLVKQQFEEDDVLLLREAPLFTLLLSEELVSLDAATARLPPEGADGELCSLAAKNMALFDARELEARTLLTLARAPMLPRAELLHWAVENAPAALLGELTLDDLEGDLLAKLRTCPKMVMSEHGLCLASELYDPEVPGLAMLLDANCFPKKQALPLLRRLGLRRSLDKNGVLASARSVRALLMRGAALLEHLDANVHLLSDDEEWVAELRSVRWLPTMLAPPSELAGLPWLGLECASPLETRPISDAHLVSATMAILPRSLEPKNEKLREILGWAKPPEPVALARQLIALSASDEQGHLATALPSIYQRLSDAISEEAGTSAEAAMSAKEAATAEQGAAGRDEDGLDRLVNREGKDAARDVERGAADVEEAATTAASEEEETTPTATTIVVSEEQGREKKTPLGQQQQQQQQQLSPAMLLAQSLLLHERWIWIDGGFVTTRAVALTGDDLRPYLFKLPQQYEEYKVFAAFGVRQAFQATDLAEATRKMFHVHGAEKLDEAQLTLALNLARLLAACQHDERAYLPDSKGKLGFAGDLAYDDAKWLGPTLRGRLRLCDDSLTHEEARSLGARSLRALLLDSDEATALPCVEVSSLLPGSIDSALLELLSCFSDCSSATLIVDEREHGSASLLHPSLVAAQGPALVLCMRGEPLKTQQLVELLTPSLLTNNRRLGAAFALTDVLQVLSGDQFSVFDPCGAFNAEGKAQGKRFSLAGDLIKRFPDQFEPFLTLPFGVSEHGCASGTVLRLPLRQQTSPLGELYKVEEAVLPFEKNAGRRLLFARSLTSVTTHRFSSKALLPRFNVERRREVSGVVRAENFEEAVRDGRSALAYLRATSSLWRPKGKFQQLFGQAAWRAPRVVFEFEVATSRFGDEDDTTVVDRWLCCSSLAPTRAIRDLADEHRPSLSFMTTQIDAPLISVAVKINGDDEGSVFVGDLLESSLDARPLLPGWYIDAPFLELDDEEGQEEEEVVAVAVEESSTSCQEQPEVAVAVVVDGPPVRRSSTAVAVVVDGPPVRRSSTAVADGPPPVRRSTASSVLLERSTSSSVLLGRRWNEAVWGAVLADVVPSALMALRDASYRRWPRLGPASSRKLSSKLVTSAAEMRCSSLAAAKLVTLPLFFSEGKWLRASEGYLRSAPLPHRVESFLSRRALLFKCPAWVASGLGEAVKRLTPAAVREILAKEHGLLAALLASKDEDCFLPTQLLRFVTSDASDDPLLRQRCWAQLRLFPLFVLQNGGLATSHSLLLATNDQQALCPTLNGRFVSSRQIRALPELFENPEFAAALGLERFNLATLAAQLEHELPPAWHGKAEVTWDKEQAIGQPAPLPPSKSWLARFWREVDIGQADAVALFEAWPLIPTTRGLVSCGRREAVVGIFQEDDDDEAGLQIAKSRAGEAAMDRQFQDRAHREEEIQRRHYKEMGEEEAGFAAEEEEEETPAPAEEEEEPVVMRAAPVLLPLLLLLEVPVLDARVWPRGVLRNSAVRAMGGAEPRRRSLDCLASEVDLLKWSCLSDAQAESLLLELIDDATSSGITMSQTGKLRSLPIFPTLAKQRIALRDVEAVAVLTANLAARLPLLKEADASREILWVPHWNGRLQTLLADLGVRKIAEAEAWSRLVLPLLATMDPKEAAGTCSLLPKRWAASQDMRASSVLRETLKVTAFVPVESGSLKRPNELLDPAASEELFLQEDSLYPALHCRTEEWLNLLREVGLRQCFDGPTFLIAAKKAASLKQPALSRRLLRLLYTNRSLAADTRSMRSLGAVPLVPVVNEEQEESFACYRDVIAPADFKLAFSAAPSLKEGDSPPRELWSTLGLNSPPEPDLVLAHVRNLSQRPREWLERGDLTPAAAFGAVFAYLEARWSSLSPAVRAALPGFPLIPVGDVDSAQGCFLVAANSRRVFLQIEGVADPEGLAPLLYELAQPLRMHAAFLTEKLKLASTPSSAEYAQVLRGLRSSNALDPNEVNAALRLVELGGSEDALIPDERGRLQSASDCVYVDDEALLRRCGSAVRVAHPRLRRATLAALGVRPISKVAKEVLSGEEAEMIEDPSCSLMTSRLRSPAFSAELARLSLESTEAMARLSMRLGLVIDRADEYEVLRAEIHSQLSLVTVKFVQALETCILIKDQKTAQRPALAFVHADLLLVALPAVLALRGAVTVADAMAPALLRHLGQPLSIAHACAALLKTDPDHMRTLRVEYTEDHDRRDALLRGTPGSLVSPEDALRLKIASRALRQGEIVAVRQQGSLRYALVLDKPSLSKARLQLGSDETATLAGTDVLIFVENTQPSSVEEPPSRPAAIEPPSSSVEEEQQGPPSCSSSEEVLRAVGELLRQAKLPPLEVGRSELLTQLAEAKRHAADKSAEADAARTEANALLSKRSLNDDDPPTEILCPITRELMRDPVIASDGHSYERAAIQRWLTNKRTSPQTNASLANKNLLPNHALKALASTWAEQHHMGPS